MPIDDLVPDLRSAPDDALADAWRDAMLRGAFEESWRVSDEVLRRRRRAAPTSELPPRHLQAIWSGDDLRGRHVLVRCYHGLGDTVQFIRYLPVLRERASRVTLWLQPALVPLVQHMRCVGGERILPLHDGDPGVDYDVDVELMELPHALRARPDAASPVPYIHAPPLRLPRPDSPRPDGPRSNGPRAATGATGAPAPGRHDDTLHVGIVWRAGDFAPERSIPADALAPLAGVPRVRWHVLQRGRALDDCPPWLHVESTSDDTVETARTMAALDLVVTVDSFPAHLAGALGVPVWVLLPANADWRWGTTARSAWYPSATLFRQSRSADWSSVIAGVADRLRDGALPRGQPAVT